jgi:AraC family transcriptional activator of mar-sox-rob regulon
MMNTGAIIQDLIDWIDNHLDSRLDIDTVAREPAIRSGTCSGSSKNIPHPLGEYIRAQKLQKSVERLAHSNEPILNVAIALGFDSQQSFNRSFKRQYGQAPGVWRRSISRSAAGISSVIFMTGRVSPDPVHDRICCLCRWHRTARLRHSERSVVRPASSKIQCPLNTRSSLQAATMSPINRLCCCWMSG